METWEPPAPARLALFHALSATPDLWAVRHCVMFGDAALDTIRYRGGAFIPRLSGVCSQVIPPARHTQQSAELWVLVWLVRLAVRLGWNCCAGHGLSGIRVPVGGPAGIHVAVKAAEATEGPGSEVAAVWFGCGGPAGTVRVTTG